MAQRFFTGLIGLICFGLGFLFARHHYSAQDREVVAKINGEPVGRREMMRSLTLYRLPALESIAQTRAVAEYAKRKGVSVLDSELDLKGQYIQDSEHRSQVLTTLRTEALIRKLILSKWSASQKQELFKTFQAGLTRYSVTVLCLQNKDDAEILMDNLNRGSSFSTLVAKYGVPLPNNVPPNGIIKDVSLFRLGELTEGQVADAVAVLNPGQTTPFINTNFGKLIVRLDEKIDDQKSLEPALDQVLIESQRNALLYRLASTTMLESGYLGSPKPRAGATPGKSTGDLAAPSASPTVAGPQELPSPKLDATPEPGFNLSPHLTPGPSGLPAPDASSPTHQNLPGLKVSPGTR